MNTAEQRFQHEDEQRWNSSEGTFEDWLELSHITAVRRGVPAGGFLPAECVAKASKPVTIYYHAEQNASAMYVLVEKDSYGIARAIKIRCTCGCSATIAIEYGEQPLPHTNYEETGSL